MTDATRAPGAPRLAWATRAGVVAILPTQLFVVPFGLVSGVFAHDVGLDIVATMFLSIAVFAGASQFAILELLQDGAPALVIIATGLAINLRFVMYAAALAPWLYGASRRGRALVGYLNVDNMFAVASVWYRAVDDARPSERVAFHLGGAALTWLVWQAATVIGFYFGAAAPAYLSLDFAAPIAFLALSAPLLVDKPAWCAAGVAVALALGLHGLPFNLNVVIGGLGGVAAGYLADRALSRRAGGVDE